MPLPGPANNYIIFFGTNSGVPSFLSKEQIKLSLPTGVCQTFLHHFSTPPEYSGFGITVFLRLYLSFVGS